MLGRTRATRCVCSALSASRRGLATEAELPSTSSAQKSTWSLLDKRAPVKKRPLRVRPENPHSGGRLPLIPDPAVAYKVFFPNFKLILMRNGPAHANDPYTATFKTPLQLTKADITAFLTQAYGLKITGIRTLIHRGKTRKAKSIADTRPKRMPRRDESYKKAFVQLQDPFWFPDRKDAAFFNTFFDKENRDRRATVDVKPVRLEKPNYMTFNKRYRGTSSLHYGLGTSRKSILQAKARRRAVIQNAYQKDRLATRNASSDAMPSS